MGDSFFNTLNGEGKEKMLHLLYARHEKTTDFALKGLSEKHQRDIVLYQDTLCRKPVARYPWHFGNKPTKRNKFVTHNCFRFRLQWV